MKALDIQLESIGTVFKVSGNGNTVISNGSPPATNGKLAVTSTSEVLDLVNTGTNGWGNMISFYDGTGAGRHLIYDDFGPTSGTSATQGDLVIQTATSGNPNGKLWVNGKVSIGTVPAITSGTTLDNNYSLYVEKGIITEKVKVAIKDGGNWSDYVFDRDYKLPNLDEVQSYISENHHLQGVPSADEVGCDGIDVAGMDATLLKKIEELTLYVLDLKKENKEIKAQLAGK
jgi:hypothetical protein